LRLDIKTAAVYQFTPKPFDLDDLLTTIQQALETAPRRQRLEGPAA